MWLMHTQGVYYDPNNYSFRSALQKSWQYGIRKSFTDFQRMSLSRRMRRLAASEIRRCPVALLAPVRS
jgi:hypothetical protein